MNIANIRSLSQQLSAPQFTTPHDVVSWMGMLQAQDYAALPWAVGIRMKHPSYQQYKKDFDAGRIIRTHLFRNTWQLVTAEDLPWMRMLYGERGLRADLSSGRAHGWNESELPPMRNAILNLLEKEEFLTRDQMAAHLQRLGHKAEGLPMMFFLRRMEFEGLVCSGPIMGRQCTYALTARRCPSKETISEEEALAILARKYFRSHGLATLEDFIWWTGLTKTQCRKGIEAVKGEMLTETIDGSTYYIHNDARTSGFHPQQHLLPAFDEYVIGYKTRHHVLKPEHNSKAYTSNGIFFPLISVSGKVVGKWNKQRDYTWFEEADECSLDKAERRLVQFHDK